MLLDAVLPQLLAGAVVDEVEAEHGVELVGGVPAKLDEEVAALKRNLHDLRPRKAIQFFAALEDEQALVGDANLDVVAGLIPGGMKLKTIRFQTPSLLQEVVLSVGGRLANVKPVKVRDLGLEFLRLARDQPHLRQVAVGVLVGGEVAQLRLNGVGSQNGGGGGRQRQFAADDVAFQLQEEVVAGVLLHQSRWFRDVELDAKVKDVGRRRRRRTLQLLPDRLGRVQPAPILRRQRVLVRLLLRDLVERGETVLGGQRRVHEAQAEVVLLDQVEVSTHQIEQRLSFRTFLKLEQRYSINQE